MQKMQRTTTVGAAVLLAALAVAGLRVFAHSETGAAPREVVEAFSDLIEAHRGFEAVDRYVSADFIEHDPSVAGGDRAGMIAYLKSHGWMDPAGERIMIHRDRTIASGPYVVVHQHLKRSPSDPILVFADIFRVERGRIVEHWDVMEPVPANPQNTRYPMY
jgi:predicted SnoaL-like aldol condensation-catalyzing enzyme